MTATNGHAKLPPLRVPLPRIEHLRYELRASDGSELIYWHDDLYAYCHGDWHGWWVWRPLEGRPGAGGYYRPCEAECEAFAALRASWGTESDGSATE